jgi:hypothetical protein
MSFPVVPCDVVLDYLASPGSIPERSTMCCVSDSQTSHAIPIVSRERYRNRSLRILEGGKISMISAQ